jgi:lipopolysaccharide/colanic/teichoic acid biosynthesis glycosyltransferase
MSAWLRLRIHLDRVAALVGLVVSAPVVVVLALAVRRHDGGPGIIAVERIGKDGAPFRMWKIRSMRVVGRDGTAGGPALTAEHDDRVTPIGRRIRAYHLDELPQLWNVLRGDMVLLGSRPEAPGLVDLDDPAWRDVLRVAPGIAGPTQLVAGAWERHSLHLGEEHYRRHILPVKLEIDRWYLRAASPFVDLFVLASLLGRFSGHAAIRLRRRVLAALPDVATAMREPGEQLSAT